MIVPVSYASLKGIRTPSPPCVQHTTLRRGSSRKNDAGIYIVEFYLIYSNNYHLTAFVAGNSRDPLIKTKTVVHLMTKTKTPSYVTTGANKSMDRLLCGLGFFSQLMHNKRSNPSFFSGDGSSVSNGVLCGSLSIKAKRMLL